MFLGNFFLANILLAARSADVQFHNWCSYVGIQTPLARLETTPRSVAGRGVFANGDIKEGDAVITIPEEVVLHEWNAAASFPGLAKKLWPKEKIFAKKRSWWHRIIRNNKQQKNYEFTHSSDLWQGSLTAFSLACMEQEDEHHQHPWSHWISQWQRSDPMQNLLEDGATWRDESNVLACVDELSAMLPGVSKIKMRTAVEMRLGRLEELKMVFDLDDTDQKVSSMFGLLTSRAIELGDGVLGVLPMFDMLNHSNEPNLALSFDGENFSLWGVRDIADGEELFVSYKDKKAQALDWDEDDAIWMLVQWGIPMPKPETTGQATLTSEKESTPSFTP